MIETGVYFGDIHSFYDLNLILAPFTPAPAKPKLNYVEISGGNGSLDLTEALGEVKYYDREFSFTFTVHPLDRLTFDEKVTQVSNALNGKRCKITLDRDSDYFWDGRCSVNQYKQDRNLKQIVITATVSPYKYKQTVTVETFDLTDEPATITLTNSRKTAVPTITCTDDNTTIVFGDSRFALSAGTYKTPEICLVAGENTMQISGGGSITFEWQEGDL